MNDQQTDPQILTLEVTPDQLMLLGAGVHMLKHFVKEETPSEKVIVSCRNVIADALPEDMDSLVFNTRFTEFCMPFFSCAYCEQIHQAFMAVDTLAHAHSQLKLAEALEGAVLASEIDIRELLAEDRTLEYLIEKGGM